MTNHIKLIVISLLLLNIGCTSMFFYPEKGLRNNEAARRFIPEDIYFQASDGTKLHGWFFKAQGESKGTIMVLHGNAENISTHVNSVLWLVKEGYDIFTFDYRGYGLSEGRATVEGVHLDAKAAMEKVFNLPQANKGRLFVLGQSIGGAIAVYTLANSPHKVSIKALITDSPFSDYRRIAREKLGDLFLTWLLQYPLSFLFDNNYSPEKQIRKISPLPLLFLHTEEDKVVPSHHSSVLYNEAGEPKEIWITRGDGHVMSFADDDTRKRFIEYLKNR